MLPFVRSISAAILKDGTVLPIRVNQLLRDLRKITLRRECPVQEHLSVIIISVHQCYYCKKQSGLFSDEKRPRSYGKH